MEKTGKKIVSKGEYAVNIGKKAALSSFGSAVFLIGAVCMALTCIGTLALLVTMRSHHPTWLDMCIFLVGVGLFGGCSAALLHFGKAAVKEARETQAGIPLTRANTADLPATDSLLRASAEPIQEQKAVLLRAADEEPQTPPEQLVRAASGHEEP